jgi:2-polyprenyl-6-methoxyphenol hydroxylase-like FAD-dependent oxidoreductase
VADRGNPPTTAAELGGEVEFGTALAGFARSDEGVSATVAKDGATEAVSARWLVGCDGGHSVVRAQAGIVFEGETRDAVRMIVADVKVDGLDPDAWHLWQHEEGLVGLCPLPSTDVFQYQAAIAPGQDPELSLANMQPILERRTSAFTRRRGPRCGAPTSASSTVTARVACSSRATQRTSTRQRAARA